MLFCFPSLGNDGTFRQAMRALGPQFARPWCDGLRGYRRVWESVVAEPFGAFLVRLGYVTPEQVQAGLRHQRRMRKMRIGEILVDRGLLEEAELDRVLADRRAHHPPPPLGEYLVDRGVLDETQLRGALDEQTLRRQRKIGEVLVELGHLTEQALQDAVAARRSAAT